jgi:hypothetical protein
LASCTLKLTFSSPFAGDYDSMPMNRELRMLLTYVSR